MHRSELTTLHELGVHFDATVRSIVDLFRVPIT
jgi:hypothetical protein